MNGIKKLCAFITAAVCFVSLSGCSGATIYSNYREVEDLELIKTVGIDLGKGGTGVVITAGSGLSLAGRAPQVYEMEASTIAEAINKMQKSPAGKETFFSHTEYVVIGESAAKNGISGFLDYIERAQNIRLKTGMFIARDSTAQKLLMDVVSEKTSTADILSFMEKDSQYVGYGEVVTCQDAASSLERYGCALVLALKAKKTPEIFGESGEYTIVPAGYGIIKDGKLAGYTDEEAAHGIGILMNALKFYNVNVDDGIGGYAALGITKAETKYKPHFESGELTRLDINIEADANVIELKDPVDIEDKKVRKNMERQIDEEIKKQVESAIELSKEMEIDFLELGGRIERQKPVKFSKIKGSWDEVFKQLEINVNVTTTLKRTYEFDLSLAMDGGGKFDE